MSYDPDDVAAFGYKQELKRSLGLADLLIYGLVFITPIAPMSVFGIVFNASHGMVPLVYVIGLVAMVFVALSYMTMSKAFPIAGSVYTYAARSLGQTVGFFAGWAILLDYLLIPTLSYVATAIAIASVYPDVSKPLFIAAMVLIATAVNYLGIDATARASFALLGVQLVILLAFSIACIATIIHGGVHVSLISFYNPAEVTPALIFGALSLAMLSFLGFDAISTLSEESREGARAIGRATMLSLCLSAVLFIAQTWLASLFFNGRTSLPPGQDTNAAFYTVAGMAGGYWLKFVLAVPAISLSLLAGAITAQAATARLLFGMARDGELPRVLAYVNPKRQVPERAVLLVAGITLATSIGLANQFELLTSMVNFGALLGFLALQASVVGHFLVRRRSRDYLRHLIVPMIGFAIVAYVLINAEANAKIAGTAWLIVGLAMFITLKRLHRPLVIPSGVP